MRRPLFLPFHCHRIRARATARDHVEGDSPRAGMSGSDRRAADRGAL